MQGAMNFIQCDFYTGLSKKFSFQLNISLMDSRKYYGSRWLNDRHFAVRFENSKIREIGCFSSDSELYLFHINKYGVNCKSNLNLKLLKHSDMKDLNFSMQSSLAVEQRKLHVFVEISFHRQRCLFFNAFHLNVRWIPCGYLAINYATRKATSSRILTLFLFLATTMTRILWYNYSLLSWQRWKLVLFCWTYHLTCGPVADLVVDRVNPKEGILTYYLAIFSWKNA